MYDFCPYKQGLEVTNVEIYFKAVDRHSMPKLGTIIETTTIISIGNRIEMKNW